MIKDSSGVELPPPAKKTIDLEGRIVKDGVRKALRDRQLALSDLVHAIQEYRKLSEGTPLTLQGRSYADAVLELNKAIERADRLLQCDFLDALAGPKEDSVDGLTAFDFVGDSLTLQNLAGKGTPLYFPMETIFTEPKTTKSINTVDTRRLFLLNGDAERRQVRCFPPSCHIDY